MTTILAIETSCDETAVAIVKKRQVLSSIVTSQIETHRQYGGVVPEVAPATFGIAGGGDRPKFEPSQPSSEST